MFTSHSNYNQCLTYLQARGRAYVKLMQSRTDARNRDVTPNRLRPAEGCQFLFALLLNFLL